jgi:hypothetical protein
MESVAAVVTTSANKAVVFRIVIQSISCAIGQVLARCTVHTGLAFVTVVASATNCAVFFEVVVIRKVSRRRLPRQTADAVVCVVVLSGVLSRVSDVLANIACNTDAGSNIAVSTRGADRTVVNVVVRLDCGSIVREILSCLARSAVGSGSGTPCSQFTNGAITFRVMACPNKSKIAKILSCFAGNARDMSIGFNPIVLDVLSGGANGAGSIASLAEGPCSADGTVRFFVVKTCIYFIVVSQVLSCYAESTVLFRVVECGVQPIVSKIFALSTHKTVY